MNGYDEQEYCPDCGRKTQNCPCAEMRAGIIATSRNAFDEADGERVMERLRRRHYDFVDGFNSLCDVVLGPAQPGDLRLYRDVGSP